MSNSSTKSTFAAVRYVAICSLFTVAAGFTLFPAAVLGGERSIVSFEARQWSASPSGRFSQVGSAANEILDFEDDLDLQEDQALEGRLVFRPSRRTMIRLGFLPELQLVGDHVVSRSITFLGQDFAINQRVVTDFTIEYARLGFAWQFISAAKGRFRLGPLIEARGFRGNLSLNAPDSPIPLSVTDEYEVAFGSAGLIAELEISDRIELFGEVTEAVTGDEGDITETEYGIRVLVLPKLMVVAGVRTLEIDFQDNGESFVFELDGVFLGAHVRF